jgi:hypothetical protein
MRFFALCVLLFIGVAAAFRPAPRFAVRSLKTARFMTEKENVELVPLEKSNIENAAAVTGGILGFVLGGPIFGVLLAAVSNYVVKKDNEAGEALKGFGKTVIESYNYLTKLNGKYNLTGTTTEALTKAVDSIDSSNESIGTVKKTVGETVEKVKEINAEFNLVDKAKQAVAAAATLSDAALAKVEELNAKVRINTMDVSFACIVPTANICSLVY